MSGFQIVDIRATTVTVPLEAPLRHANGAHWGRFVRTIVEVETDDGLIGLGEMGGGGKSAEAAFAGARPVPARPRPVPRSRRCGAKICNPTASLYNNRTQLHAAIEFACLDLIGQRLGVPVHDLLGGRLRDDVAVRQLPVLPLRRRDGVAEVRTPEQLVEHARELKRTHGFTHAQAQGRRLPAGLRAGVLPRAGRGASPRTACATTRTRALSLARRDRASRTASRTSTTTTSRTRPGA